MERKNYQAIEVKLDLKGYDPAGTYWGVGKTGERLWAVSWEESTDEGGRRGRAIEGVHVRAATAGDALAEVSAKHEEDGG